MSMKRAVVLATLASVALAAVGNAVFAAEASKAPTSLAGMLNVATFTDPIGFFDMAAIYACSLASIALIIEHGITIRRSVLVPEISVAQIKTMFDERRFREALEYCQNDPSFV